MKAIKFGRHPHTFSIRTNDASQKFELHVHSNKKNVAKLFEEMLIDANELVAKMEMYFMQQLAIVKHIVEMNILLCLQRSVLLVINFNVLQSRAAFFF